MWTVDEADLLGLVDTGRKHVLEFVYKRRKPAVVPDGFAAEVGMVDSRLLTSLSRCPGTERRPIRIAP